MSIDRTLYIPIGREVIGVVRNPIFHDYVQMCCHTAVLHGGRYGTARKDHDKPYVFSVVFLDIKGYTPFTTDMTQYVIDTPDEIVNSWPVEAISPDAAMLGGVPIMVWPLIEIVRRTN